MVWSELALLGAGAVIGQASSLVQRRADRKDRREDSAQAQGAAREGRAEAQTRAAVLEVAEHLQGFSASAEGPGNVLSGEIEGLVRVLRRQGLLVADAELRARIELAKDCFEWRDAIQDKMGAGIVYLTRYIVGDLEPAIGAYLRDEPLPSRSERMNDCEHALKATWESGEHC